MVFFKSSPPSRASLPQSQSRHTFSDSIIAESMETAERIITRWTSSENDDSSTSLSVSSSFCSLSSLFSRNNREEARQFIDAVKGLHSSMQRLISVSSGPEKLVRAQSLMKIAMKHLEKEFYRILKSNRRYLDPESVSHRCSSREAVSSASRSVSDFESDGESEISDFDDVKSVDYGEAGADGDADAMVDLKMIADCMFFCGYGKECVRIYKKIRKSVVKEGLISLGVENLNFSKVQKMDWETLDAKIGKWLRAVKIAVKTLFYGERILCDFVFSSTDSLRESCFSEITRDSALNLFVFPESVAKYKKSPEKIFRTLDLYEAISDLFPEIDSMFSFDSTTAVRSQVVQSLIKIGDSVRSMMTEFEASMTKESSRSSVPGGGIHHLARYVMNFIAFLADYSVHLSDILGAEPPPPSPLSYPGNGEDQYGNAEYSSPVSVRIAWLILILLAKIDGKAQFYNDVALSYLFLANNLQYAVVKVESSVTLKSLLGDDWVTRHNLKIKHFCARYEKLAWGNVMTSLPEDPTAEISLDRAEEIFRRFETAFREAYTRQISWVIPDPRLRDEIKVSIAGKLGPAYSDFYQRYHRCGSNRSTREGSVVGFAPEDLGNYLSDLFFGADDSGSVSSKSDKSDSSRSGR